MAVPLVQLLETVPDQEIRVAAGVNGLQNPIRWVHMVEGIEISSFLEGGELAFITGIALNEDCTLERLVRQIQLHGAGGVVVNTGPYIKTIPPEVSEFCNVQNFPLLVVPWRVHMATIMRRFSQALLHSEQEQTEWTAAVKNMIFRPQEESLYRPALESRGLQSEWPYCVTLLEPADPAQMPNCLCAVEDCLTARNTRMYYAELNGKIVLLSVNCTAEEIRADVLAVLQACGMGVYAGTGRATKSVRCLAASYHLAQKVVNLQRKRQATGEPAFYADLGVYRLLMSVEDQELREYTAAILGPLQAADAAGGTAYMDFLRTWLNCGCSTRRTAEQLFLHRNTVEYHLRRIGALLHMDMSDMEVRLQLSLALKMLDMN